MKFTIITHLERGMRRGNWSFFAHINHPVYGHASYGWDYPRSLTETMVRRESKKRIRHEIREAIKNGRV